MYFFPARKGNKTAGSSVTANGASWVEMLVVGEAQKHKALEPSSGDSQTVF
jgi:hypothetical protein